MTTTHNRLQILESLSNLDSYQSEKVLAYIKGLSAGSKEEERYQLFKHQAMQEIRLALSSEALKNSF